MPGPFVIIPAGALSVPSATATTGLIVGGVVATGVGLSWLVSSDATTIARPPMDISYQDFLKKRLTHYKETQDLNPNEAMKLIGPEWQQFKADHQKVTSVPSTPIKQSKLKGAQSMRSLHLEMPYHIESQPDLAAAWDVAEGILDFLLTNAAGITQVEAFRRQAASAYARAKGMSSEGDHNEYELGQNLGQTLLLVMAHRGMTQNQWIEMLPPQIIEAPLSSSLDEDKGFIDQGLELLGLNDSESNTSKAAQKVMDTVVDAGAQSILDILTNPQ